jgi:hypothetical protein
MAEFSQHFLPVKIPNAEVVPKCSFFECAH